MNKIDVCCEELTKLHLFLTNTNNMITFHTIANIKQIAKSIGELVPFLRDIQLSNCVLAGILYKHPLLRGKIENCCRGKVATKNEENNHPQPAVF